MGEYLEVCKSVFDVDQVVKGVIPVGDDRCRFGYKRLDDGIKAIVRKGLQDQEAILAIDEERDEDARTFVVATSALHAEAQPTL
jgi:hypothetical protein